MNDSIQQVLSMIGSALSQVVTVPISSLLTLLLIGGCAFGCTGKRVDVYTDREGVQHTVTSDQNDPVATSTFLYNTGAEAEVDGNWGTGHFLGFCFNLTGSTGHFHASIKPRKPATQPTGGAE